MEPAGRDMLFNYPCMISQVCRVEQLDRPITTHPMEALVSLHRARLGNAVYRLV